MGLPSRSTLAQLLPQGCCTGLCKEMLAWEIHPAHHLLVTVIHTLSAPSPFFSWGGARGSASAAKGDLLLHTWGIWGAHHGNAGLHKRLQPRSGRGMGLALGKGSPKPVASTVLPKLPSLQPYEAGAVPADPRNGGLEGGSGPLGGLAGPPKAVGRAPAPKHPSPAPPGTTAGPQWPSVAKHRHHFTLPE